MPVEYMPAEYMMSVDPGVEGGYAVWCGNVLTAHGLYPDYHCARNIEWQTRMELGLNQIEQIIASQPEGPIKSIVCEKPFFHETEGGREVASTGALVKLSMWVGGLIHLGTCYDVDVELVNVATWKGQMPKTAVINRVKKKIPGIEARSHEWDAIGIGLWKLGRF